MREEITRDSTRPIKRVYNEILTETAENIPIENTPEFANVQSALKRTRSSLIPDVPQTVNEVVIEGDWVITWSGRECLSHLDNAWSVCIFATDKNFRRLSL